jgi:hypothetical protein
METGFIDKFPVKGIFVDNRKRDIKKYVSRYSKFELEREPDNEYDPNAIKVLLPVRQGQFKLELGYIPKEMAARIAPEMDSGRKFSANFRTKILNDKTGDLIHLYLNLNLDD